MFLFYKFRSNLVLTLGILIFGISSIFGFQVSGESFDANFKISSWTATKNGSVITSEEDKAWKFISKKKYLDIERVNLDKRLLKNFFLDKGFSNFSTSL